MGSTDKIEMKDKERYRIEREEKVNADRIEREEKKSRAVYGSRNRERKEVKQSMVVQREN